jgi:hypothetical protein
VEKYRPKRTKLSWEEVARIRELYAQGYSQGKLCQLFDVGIAQIGRIVRREVWRDAPLAPLAPLEAVREELRAERAMQEAERATREAEKQQETRRFEQEMWQQIQEKIAEKEAAAQATEDFWRQYLARDRAPAAKEEQQVQAPAAPPASPAPAEKPKSPADYIREISEAAGVELPLELTLDQVQPLYKLLARLRGARMLGSPEATALRAELQAACLAASSKG